MQLPPARVGDAIEDIDTPALIIELNAFERNLRKMAAFAAAAKVRLRPHAKTHRCPAIAIRQMALNAVGQCCQKVGEAEALVQGGIGDILVSNQVADRRKLLRLAALAKEASVTLCLDAVEQVEAASWAAGQMGVTLGALVEIDVGMRRCGVVPGEAALGLAQCIAQAPGLKFMGLQAYQGKAQHAKTYAQRQSAVQAAAAMVLKTKQMLQAAGLECATIAGAGTGTYMFEGASGLWNELQCGSYIFMDGEYRGIEGQDGRPYAEFEQSLFILASVMSTSVPGGAILDAGLKSYTLEKGLPVVHGRTDLELVDASDEHGATVSRNPESLPALGERVMLAPSHCDPTVNLHDWYVGVRQGRVESVWPISARGASS